MISRSLHNYFTFLKVVKRLEKYIFLIFNKFYRCIHSSPRVNLHYQLFKELISPYELLFMLEEAYRLQDARAIQIILNYAEKDYKYRVDVLHRIAGRRYNDWTYPERFYSRTNEASGGLKEVPPLLLDEETLLFVRNYTTPEEFSQLIFQMILTSSTVNPLLVNQFFDRLQKLFDKLWPVFRDEISHRLKKACLDIENNPGAVIALIRWSNYCCSPQLLQEHLPLVIVGHGITVLKKIFISNCREEFAICAKYINNWSALLREKWITESDTQLIFTAIKDQEKIRGLLRENDYALIRHECSFLQPLSLKIYLEQFEDLERKQIIKKFLPGLLKAGVPLHILKSCVDLMADKNWISSIVDNQFKDVDILNMRFPPRWLLTFFQYLPEDKQAVYALHYGPSWITNFVTDPDYYNVENFCSLLQLLIDWAPNLSLTLITDKLHKSRSLPSNDPKIIALIDAHLQFFADLKELKNVGDLRQTIIMRPEKWNVLLNMHSSAQQLAALAVTSKKSGDLLKLPQDFLRSILLFLAPAQPDPIKLLSAMQKVSDQKVAMEVKDDADQIVKKTTRQLTGRWRLWEKFVEEAPKLPQE